MDVDGRLGFEEASKLIRQAGQCAFAAVPIFTDDGQSAEGVRVFVLQSDGMGGICVRFVAGPFFSAALAADEILPAAQIPDRVRQLRFLPSTCEEAWFGEPIQVLVGKLMQASRASAPHMPDYLGAPARTAAPEVRFPVAMIGRAADAVRKR